MVTIISHSAKGTTWKKHKYIRKENGRYIYPNNIKDAGSEDIKEVLDDAVNRDINIVRGGKTYRPEDYKSVETVRNTYYDHVKGKNVTTYTNYYELKDGNRARSSTQTLEQVRARQPKTRVEKAEAKVRSAISKIRGFAKYPKEVIRDSGMRATNKALNKLGITSTSASKIEKEARKRYNAWMK